MIRYFGFEKYSKRGSVGKGEVTEGDLRCLEIKGPSPCFESSV